MVDEVVLEGIQNFCFPNGVLVMKLDYEPGKELCEQAEKTSETINHILFQKKKLRKNMFVFSLDASEEISR